MIVMAGETEKARLDGLEDGRRIAVDPGAEMLRRHADLRALEIADAVRDIGHVVRPAQGIEGDLGRGRNACRRIQS